MLQFLAAASRLAAGAGRASAAGRAMGARTIGSKGVKRGGGFANTGFKLPKERFASRALESAWALQAWNQQLESWFPSVKHSATVVVVGGKTTPNTDVVHAALSIAFGALSHRPSSIGKITIAVKNNPTTNEVAVTFIIASVAALFIAELLSNILARPINIINVIGEGDSDIDDVVRGVKIVIVENNPLVPGVGRRGQQGVPPGGNQGGAGGNPLLKEIHRINDALAGQFGGGACFHMGRDAIFGGKPPLLTQMKNKGGKLFDEAVYKKWLTRDPDANPLPPAADGVDLRTLVAQVLHDPGVRPPAPQTDKGPPVVLNEVQGR